MIELFRAQDDLQADRIEAALQEMVAAYRVHRATPVEAARALGVDAVVLPVVRDGTELVQGPDAIARFLEETARTLERWRRFQSDACYIDDDGSVC